jgi:hypothetical protein
MTWRGAHWPWTWAMQGEGGGGQARKPRGVKHTLSKNVASLLAHRSSLAVQWENR